MPLRLIPGEPALLLDGDGGIVVISDIHLGYERALEAKGVHVPEQTLAMVGRVKALHETTGARRLVVLGDVKHDIKGASLFTSVSVAKFFRELGDEFRELYVVPGNHDGGLEALLPPRIRLSGPGGLSLRTADGRVGFFHGHAHPSAEVLGASVLVSGHQHLILERQGSRQGIWVRLTFGPTSNQRTLVLMPAFNRLLAGIPAAEFSPRLWNPVLSAFFEGPHSAEVFLLDGSKLGRLEELAGRLLVESD